MKHFPKKKTLAVAAISIFSAVSISFANAATTFVGAGDIADSTSTSSPPFRTASLINAMIAADPNTVVYTTGDNAYLDGTASDFSTKYHPSWGQFRSSTYPSPGNHDWYTANAQGYLDYFCPNSSDCRFPGGAQQYYYSYNTGGWHVIALDSELPMSAGSPQVTWLNQDLAANSATCTIAYWHKPYYTSGANHANFTSAKPVWDVLYAYDADIVLNGHNHHYERFAPQDANGNLDVAKGIREFVVGSGGAGLYNFNATPDANSESRIKSHGVLKFGLDNGNYTWEFRDINDAVLDSGTGTCVDGTPPPPDTTPPTVPANLTATTVSSSQINLSWNASTDNVGVTGYDVLRCTGSSCTPVTVIASTTGTTYNDTGLSASTTYTFSVRARDAAGNISGESATASATTSATSTFTFPAVGDATLKKSFPNSNFGSANRIELDASSGSPTHKGILKFSVTGIGVGGVVQSAKLRIYNRNSSNSGGSFHRVADSSWTESGINWNNAPLADAAPVASLGAVKNGNWYEVDVTPIVTGDGIVSIMAQTLSSDGADYNSKEATSNRPELIVTALVSQSAFLPSGTKFSRQMSIGTIGEDVSLLQRLLASYDHVYPEELVTGYFGSLTATAVSAFQSANGIPPIGRVGPITLQKLDDVFGYRSEEGDVEEEERAS